jgi:hypothetical protein
MDAMTVSVSHFDQGLLARSQRESSLELLLCLLACAAESGTLGRAFRSHFYRHTGEPTNTGDQSWTHRTIPVLVTG